MDVLDPATRFAVLRLTCVPEVGPAAQARVIAAWRAGKVTPAAFFERTADEHRGRCPPSTRCYGWLPGG